MHDIHCAAAYAHLNLAAVRKAACSTVRSGATMMGMDLRAIEGSAVIPGRFNLAEAAQ
jgi:hypothetical protein